ncbi:MAG: dihydropteroate synthase, partial [Firmicutes bacterium]|nr:dihydropteroate synthase [Bacillota bacterium]
MERTFYFRGRRMPLGEKTYVMGIVNVTPDSFSDGNRYQDVSAALHHVKALQQGGAEMIDIGAESTRPGYTPVAAEEEWSRLAPVLEAIKRQWPESIVSVDTQKAVVARRAIAAGADIINDIWGLSGDPDMLDVLADSDAGLILMYNRNPPWPDKMVSIEEMQTFFIRQVQAAAQKGVDPLRIIIDPGIGFGYSVEDNWTVLRALDRFQNIGA